MLSLGQTMKLVVGNPNMKYVRVIKQEPIMSILAKQKKLQLKVNRALMRFKYFWLSQVSGEIL